MPTVVRPSKFNSIAFGMSYDSWVKVFKLVKQHGARSFSKIICSCLSGSSKIIFTERTAPGCLTNTSKFWVFHEF